MGTTKQLVWSCEKGSFIMKQRFQLLSFICLLLLSGCWDKSELNELAVATGIGIDKADDGYLVSVQTVNSSEVTSQLGTSGFMPVFVRSETSSTMYDAIRKLSLTNSKRPYGSHLQVLVISEEIAKEEIGNILDYFSRDNDLRALLEIPEEISGLTSTINMKELLNILTLPGRSPIIPVFDLLGDISIGQSKANTENIDPPVTYNYLGSSVFNKDQLIGWINAEEVKAVNYLTDNIGQSIEDFTCSDGEDMSIEILNSKTKREVKLDQEGKPVIEVNIQSDANIGEFNCSMDLLNPNVITELENLLAKQKAQEIDEVIKKVQTEYKTDIFGFGEQIYRFQPKVWNDMNENWGEHFANLKVHVKVTINITQIGSIKNSIQLQIKE